MIGLAVQADVAAFLAVDNNINAYDARRTMKGEAACAKRALDHLVRFAVAALTGLSVWKQGTKLVKRGIVRITETAAADERIAGSALGKACQFWMLTAVVAPNNRRSSRRRRRSLRRL